MTERWLDATPEQRRYLNQLLRLLKQPISDLKWEDIEIRETFRMFKGRVRYEEKVQRDFYDHEKIAIRNKIISRIYDQVRGTPAEVYFRSIMAQMS